MPADELEPEDGANGGALAEAAPLPFAPDAAGGEVFALAEDVAGELPLGFVVDEEVPDAACEPVVVVVAGLFEPLLVPLPLPVVAEEPAPPDVAAVLVEPGVAVADGLLVGPAAVGPPLPAVAVDGACEVAPAAGPDDPVLVQTDAGEAVGDVEDDPGGGVLLDVVLEPVDAEGVVEAGAGAKLPLDPDPAEPELAAIDADVGNGDGGVLLSSLEVLLPLTLLPATDFDGVAPEPDAPPAVEPADVLDAPDRS